MKNAIALLCIVISTTAISVLTGGLVFDLQRISSEKINNAISFAYDMKDEEIEQNQLLVTESADPDSIYDVYVNEVYDKSFSVYYEALRYAKGIERASIREKGKHKWIWDNYPPYNVFTSYDVYEEFETFAEASIYAASQQRAFIYYRKDNNLIWSNANELKGKARIDVQLIKQNPELARGCEVTSLAMLLRYKGIKVDKMTLAMQIKKDETLCQVRNGKIFYGNPNRGFVGDIYTFSKSGLGVYSTPIHDLMSRYLPYSSMNLTGCDFEFFYYMLEAKNPVWVIVNNTYTKLPESAFETWNTPDGEIKITYKEHSVLLTGYDDKYVYFCDPLGVSDRAEKEGFKQAWVQMGRHAVACSY